MSLVILEIQPKCIQNVLYKCDSSPIFVIHAGFDKCAERKADK